MLLRFNADHQGTTNQRGRNPDRSALSRSYFAADLVREPLEKLGRGSQGAEEGGVSVALRRIPGSYSTRSRPLCSCSHSQTHSHGLQGGTSSCNSSLLLVTCAHRHTCILSPSTKCESYSRTSNSNLHLGGDEPLTTCAREFVSRIEGRRHVRATSSASELLAPATGCKNPVRPI